MTAAGLRHLARLKKLRVLVLNRTRVSDAELRELSTLGQRDELHSKSTVVSAIGARRLALDLPPCRIERE